MGITNYGINGFGGPTAIDCFTGEVISIGCEFPIGSLLEHTYGIVIWAGAVVGGDTLVSTGVDFDQSVGLGREFFPDVEPFGNLISRTSLDPEKPEFIDAVSEQDFVAVFTDTLLKLTRDYFANRIHKPLGIEVTQNSYSWSYGYAEDFVLFDLIIENIGDKTLNDFYLGLYVDGDVGFVESGGKALDDLSGFLQIVESYRQCEYIDTVNLAWTSDNDGDPIDGEFTDKIFPGIGLSDSRRKSGKNVTGIKFLGNPDISRISYNWWVHNHSDPGFDYGPRHRKEFRDFRTGGLGTPLGDVNRYHILSNGEIDYVQAYNSAILQIDPVWIYPPQYFAINIATGTDVRYVLSIGPYTLYPGASISIPFAYVAGENFHTDPDNLVNLPDDPDAYYDNINFTDFTKNAQWAERIYDNPGFDTDGDGYAGDFRVCVLDSINTESGWVATIAETTYYRGDGIPDWRAAAPPPALKFWLTPTVNGVHVRFNGSRSETEKDFLTQIVDFEGYHIWLGRDDRESSYSLVAGYDRENFDKFVWNPTIQPYPNFELENIPFSLDELRCLYARSVDKCNDMSFNPLDYTRGTPYYLPDFSDSIFYFMPHNFNASQLGLNSPIQKRFPDEPIPPLNIDSLTQDNYTTDGYLKYYEYEFTIDNLLPTVPYWVNVTVFDFGSPEAGLSPLETSKTLKAQELFPFSSLEQSVGGNLKVYIYPNPYRIDGNYRRRGFEGRTREYLPNEKVRAIHFANLPPKCIIRIHSLDGDLVRKITHDVDSSDPKYTHDEFNLVTRNRQAVVSGIYYWTVEFPDGEVQMGKMVILL